MEAVVVVWNYFIRPYHMPKLQLRRKSIQYFTRFFMVKNLGTYNRFENNFNSLFLK